MNIKDVEKATGISKQNIRFYEKSGLLHPKRNEANQYREYTAEEVRILKLVKMLRMLDMPVEQIRLVLNNPEELYNLLGQQTKLLEQKLEETKYAIGICENLRKSHCTAENVDVDSYLAQMEQNPGDFFTRWVSDYKSVKEYQHSKTFTFTPDREVTDQYSFANALYDYAMENNQEIIITKEGMSPEFVLDGVEYTAERNYTAVKGFPVAVIRCIRKDGAGDASYQHGRKKWLQLLRICWPAILEVAFLVITRGTDSLQGLFSSTEGILALLALTLACVAMSIRNYHYYWNMH